MAMTMVVMKKKLTLFTKCEYKHIYIYIYIYIYNIGKIIKELLHVLTTKMVSSKVNR